ncbi:PD-(D/E)XK nuclease-like domain-containing protein [Nocardia farcinica]|uniref:PD-(D/E)XK nuclease-like domain-containing protein n=1 Tax=Nocardia farcinica TaxID=37329 RepID=UPI00189458ED|nr:PD-(D/E)XK nuclease-like domain-containing protein [Nocardia farcinica]MBF6411235.1 PD-(D/E)XK nuclease-like domain-containing protein [Nocardia farcinica]
MSGPNHICHVSDLDREACPHCQPEPAAPAPEPAAPSEPGLYAGVPEAVYHGDRRSLSSSGARRLLEVTPHRWRWEQDHPRPASDEMEWGSAVHTLVLGAGPPPVDTGFDRWQSGEAKKRVAQIRAAGGIPMKPKDFARARAAADRVRAHPVVADVLSDGQPELSAYARDPETGVMMRARLDWLRFITPTSVLVADLKTSSKPGPVEWAWSAADFGYFAQGPYYTDVLAALPTPIEVVTWLWIVVCSDPPHEVWVSEMPAAAFDLGRRRNRRALDRYAECVRTGTWPTHMDGIYLTDLPEKTYRREEYLL